MVRRSPQLLLWDAPRWFRREWEGTAWFVFGSLGSCAFCILMCLATDAFDIQTAITIGPTARVEEATPRTVDRGARELVIATPATAPAVVRALVTSATTRAVATRRTTRSSPHAPRQPAPSPKLIAHHAHR